MNGQTDLPACNCLYKSTCKVCFSLTRELQDGTWFWYFTTVSFYGTFIEPFRKARLRHCVSLATILFAMRNVSMSRKAGARNGRSIHQYLLTGNFSVWAPSLCVPDPPGAGRRPGPLSAQTSWRCCCPEHHFLFPRGWARHHQQV